MLVELANYASLVTHSTSWRLLFSSLASFFSPSAWLGHSAIMGNNLLQKTVYIWPDKNLPNETLSFVIYGQVKNSQFQAFYSNYFLAGEFNRSSQHSRALGSLEGKCVREGSAHIPLLSAWLSPTIRCGRLFIVSLLGCTGGLEQHTITHVGSFQCTLEGGQTKDWQ